MGKRGPGGGGDKVRPPKQTRWVLPQRPYKAEDPADYLMRWIEATPVEAGILEGSRFHVQDWQREFLRIRLRRLPRGQHCRAERPQEERQDRSCRAALSGPPVRP